MFGQVADSRTISIWLIGYYNDLRNSAVIDVTAMQKGNHIACVIPTHL